MAANCVLTEDQFLCGICLDVFIQPVTLPCGHNFCKGCIDLHWTIQGKNDCPTCKVVFPQKLELHINIFIAKMAQQYKKSTRVGAPSVRPRGSVMCDVCVVNKAPALKSCLVCVASYCQEHLEPHLTALQLKRHQLTEPVQNLEGRMCGLHDKPLELFCRSDQTCVCMMCSLLEHKHHQVVPLKEECDKKKSELWKTEAELERSVEMRRKKVEEFRRIVKLNRDAADKELAQGNDFFRFLTQSVEKAQDELVRNIEAKQRSIEHEANALVQELEKEVSQLTKRQSEVRQLSHAQDQLQFLQSIRPQPSLRTKDWTKVQVSAEPFEGTLKTTVQQLEEKLSKQLKRVMRSAEMKHMHQFAVDITLDPETAHPALILSYDKRQVYHGSVDRDLPNNSKRFNPSCCVLGKQCFSSGKFYFEVHVEGKTRWTVGVAKASIKRKGVIAISPENGHWAIWLKNGSEYAALEGSPRLLAMKTKPKRVGVFVDYDLGRVCFYDVNTGVLIHSFVDCYFSEDIQPLLSPGLNHDKLNSAPLILGLANH
ncbi:E3 ubiquitin-protein ligase TRIM39-like [Nerophis ophidion]|uniref:E3 ubiquitin-protein ligase TRIM39-like n=1 Tax=Nerophis ophidion TaxID=159077 RepID=UPI002ADFD2FF|nr:E3 ubiquitin-protein ligase TRIM39-like [Nerophis ophidion]